MDPNGKAKTNGKPAASPTETGSATAGKRAGPLAPAPEWAPAKRPAVEKGNGKEANADSCKEEDEVCGDGGSSKAITIDAHWQECIPVKAGPLGAPHVGRYAEWDDGYHLTVELIILTYTKGDSINSIQVEYRDPTGTKVFAPKHGGGGGNTYEMIQVSSAITWMSGHYDSLEGNSASVLRSLQFGTREGYVYGPYGLERGTPFCFKVEKEICGFHGLADDSGLKAIGVYVNRMSGEYHGSLIARAKSVASINSVKRPLHKQIGPFITPDKNSYVEWDDGSHFGVKRIILAYTKGCHINSIQVEYHSATGAISLGPRHGSGGDTFEVIQISTPITCLSGHFDSVGDKNSFITSLKFVTAGGYIYGPYGREHGTEFCFKVKEGICGFHGLSSRGFLRSIGVYISLY